jgi:hypothetical protein
MPDLPDRRKREREIILALLLFWRDTKKPITDWDGFRAGVKNAIYPTLRQVAFDAAGGLGKSLDKAKFEKRADGYAEKQSTTLAKGVSKTVREKTLEIKLAGGDVEEAFTESDAETIAATETTGAISAGEGMAVGALAAAGIALRPKWYTERDARVCEICGNLHGKGIEVYGIVSVTGPPAHPRCRCWLEYKRTT